MSDIPAGFPLDQWFDLQAQLNKLTDRRISLTREYEKLTIEHQIAVPSIPVGSAVSSPPERKLLEAAEEGAIVVVNVSALRCDAIIAQSSGLDSLQLKNLSYEDARSHAIRYLDCLVGAQKALDDFLNAREGAKMGDWAAARQFIDASNQLQLARQIQERILDETLCWLWEAITKPVLCRLNLLDASVDNKAAQRVWWCPTGPLTILPLHAASAGSGPSQESLLDHVVSSYTPTIGALLSARKTVEREPTAENTDKFLLVSLPATPGEQSLPHTVAEADSILSRLSSDQVTVHQQEDATQEHVIGDLSTHRWVHFGCHADQDLMDPSKGALTLYDGKLSILDLGQLRLNGDFAFLSACKTATGGVTLTEEAMTLAAAMYYTGFRRVIATLWSVQDAVAAEIAELVYDDLIEGNEFNPSSSAIALHRAVAKVRSDHPGRPTLWSPFVHIGL